MLTGTKRSGRVLAASLLLLTTAAAAAAQTDHDAEAAFRLQHRRRLSARHLHAVCRLLAEARQGIRSDEGGGDRQDRRGPAAADGHHHLKYLVKQEAEFAALSLLEERSRSLADSRRSSRKAGKSIQRVCPLRLTLVICAPRARLCAFLPQLFVSRPARRSPLPRASSRFRVS